MFVLKVLAVTMLGPSLVCAGLALAIPRLVGRSFSDVPWASGVALAAGYLTGHALIFGFPSLPPTDTVQWLFLAVGLGGLLLALPGGPRWPRVGILVVFAGLLTVTLKPMFEYHWTAREGLIWSVVLLVWLFGLDLFLVRLSHPDGAGPVLLPLFAALGGLGAALLGLSATTSLAQLAGSAGSCLLVLALVSRLRSPAQPSWIGVGLTILGGLALNGLFYAQLSGWSAASLGAAPLAAALASWRPFRDRSVLFRVAVVVLFAVLILLPCLSLEVRDFLATPEYDPYEY